VTALPNDFSVSTIPDTMTTYEKRHEAPADSRSTMIIIVAVGAAIVIALFFYVLMRSAGSTPGTEPTLQGAIRPGTPEFDQYSPNIKLDDPEAEEAKRALGDIVMSLHTTVRNLTGKTLNGLEIRAAVVDHQGKAVKERTVVVIPIRQAELEPNKTIKVQVMLEGMSDTDDRANIKMEVTGFKFKE
jgi:flagellar basal body-associated protein FliL